MEDKKIKLIEALKAERDKLKTSGFRVIDLDKTIEYLETGKSDVPRYKFGMLDAAREDFETLCKDYGVI